LKKVQARGKSFGKAQKDASTGKKEGEEGVEKRRQRSSEHRDLKNLKKKRNSRNWAKGYGGSAATVRLKTETGNDCITGAACEGRKKAKKSSTRSLQKKK